MDNKVIVLKDWVPSWVKASYMSQEEIDALNEEYEQSKSCQNESGSASVNPNTFSPNNEKFLPPESTLPT